MRVPLSWLREFVGIDEAPEVLADRLAMLGFGHEPPDRVGDEVIFDLETASNRPDLLSVLGVAREIAAAVGREVTEALPPRRPASRRGSTPPPVTVENPAECLRYTAHVITGVRVGPSPAPLARRLEAAGVRSINNVVDATNYVMLERGQPLHAFDLDRVAGPRIVVRRAHPGEPLMTLDGVARVLDPETLVIADAERAVGVAGVMGGADTEIGPFTTRVLLEAAAFDGPLVRRSARRLGLRTESSARFERGLDPRGVLAAARRGAALLAEVAGGEVAARARDVYPHPARPAPIGLRLARLPRVLGLDVPEEIVVAILRRLGCGVTRRGRRLTVRVPAGRVDLRQEEDLIEEVARHYGYDRIPEAMPVEALQAGSVAPAIAAERTARDLLIRAGLTEAVTLSLVSAALLDRLGVAADDPEGALIPLANPLLADHTHLRAMVLPGLLEAVRVNVSRGVESVHLFEIGRTFHRGSQGALTERRSLGLVLRGDLLHGWNLPPEAAEATFFHLQGVLEDFCAELRVAAATEAAARPWLHPGRAARLVVDGEEVGVFGELHPEAAARFEVPGRVYVAEVNLDALLARAPSSRRLIAPPRFPSLDRDLAVFVPATVPQAEVLRVIREAGGELLASAELFDVYRGSPAPPGHHSLAYTLRFRAPDRTLTAAEADAILVRIQDALHTALEAQPRT